MVRADDAKLGPGRTPVVRHCWPISGEYASRTDSGPRGQVQDGFCRPGEAAGVDDDADCGIELVLEIHQGLQARGYLTALAVAWYKRQVAPGATSPSLGPHPISTSRVL